MTPKMTYNDVNDITQGEISWSVHDGISIKEKKCSVHYYKCMLHYIDSFNGCILSLHQQHDVSVINNTV